MIRNLVKRSLVPRLFKANFVHLLLLKQILFIALILSIVSCSDLSKPEQLERLSELKERTVVASGLLDENRLKNGAEIETQSAGLIEVLKQFESDTIDVETAMKLDDFIIMYEAIAPTMNSFHELKKTIDVQQLNLERLERDIEIGSGKRDKYDSYIDFEEGKIIEIETAVNAYVEQKKNITETYEQLINEIANLLDSNINQVQ